MGDSRAFGDECGTASPDEDLTALPYQMADIARLVAGAENRGGGAAPDRGGDLKRAAVSEAVRGNRREASKSLLLQSVS